MPCDRIVDWLRRPSQPIREVDGGTFQEREGAVVGRDQGGFSTKQRYVEIAYLMIKDQGIENISIREIAKRVGCTSAVLYKYFGNMDYLKLLATMRFLEDYTKELTEIESHGGNYIKQDIVSWRAFNRYAFANPPIFLHLFWDTDKGMFEDAVAEYFQLFPPKRGKNDDMFFGYVYAAAYSGEIQQRDLVLLRRAANEGTITIRDAEYLSRVDGYIAESMLRQHVKDYREPGVAEASAAECNALIEKTIGLCLDEDTRKALRSQLGD